MIVSDTEFMIRSDNLYTVTVLTITLVSTETLLLPVLFILVFYFLPLLTLVDIRKNKYTVQLMTAALILRCE